MLRQGLDVSQKSCAQSVCIHINQLSKIKSCLVLLCNKFLLTGYQWRTERSLCGVPVAYSLCKHPIKKTLNIIFSHYASNGNKQITCATVTELI